MGSNRTLDESNEAAGAATNLAQSIANTASSARKSRASSAGDLGETLLGPVGGVALVAAASEAHGRGAEHGASERRDHLDGGCRENVGLIDKKGSRRKTVSRAIGCAGSNGRQANWK
jgi:hypothetical protein